MKVNVTGRHVTLTSELETYALEKFSKLDRYFSGIQRADVILRLEGHGTTKTCVVEATVVLGQGARLHGRGEAPDDMLVAVDMAEARLEKQVRRFHAKLKARRDRADIPPVEPVVATEREATYEQIVRQMLEEEGQ